MSCEELIDTLNEYADWAESNIWEIPIDLPDVLRAAAAAIQPKISVALYDEEEVYENCTVQILRNSVTGEVSIGWTQGELSDITITHN